MQQFKLCIWIKQGKYWSAIILLWLPFLYWWTFVWVGRTVRVSFRETSLTDSKTARDDTWRRERPCYEFEWRWTTYDSLNHRSNRTSVSDHDFAIITSGHACAEDCKLLSCLGTGDLEWTLGLSRFFTFTERWKSKTIYRDRTSNDKVLN